MSAHSATIASATPVTNGLVVYLNFDDNIDAQAGTTNNGAIYTNGAVNGPRYKAGMIAQAAAFANMASDGQPEDWAISLGNLEWIYANTFSVSFWERTTHRGDDALMGNKDWTSGTNIGWVISSLDPKNVNWNAVGGIRCDVELNPPFSDGNWHLVTVTFDRATNQVTSYIDGTAVSASDISPSGTASLNAGFGTLVGSSGNGSYSAAADIDDLGIWTRVLSPEEVVAIYHTGLNGHPLTGAVPGQFPLITVQPGSMNLAVGSAATFTVTATGPGSLTYQWKFNGTIIVGATNATLVIPSISAAGQGVYSVLVSNGSGASGSAGAVLTVYELAVTGQWDFDRGDLRATVGSDLEYLGDTTNITSFPSMNINGHLARVMAFGSNAITQGFYMRHGARPNGGGHFVNQYTLIMDVNYPTTSSGEWRALFQTDLFNHAGNDAEFYLGNSGSLPDANGLGADGQFNGLLAPDTWYRMAFAVDLTAPAGQQLTKFLNGVKVGSQSLSGGVDGRYALGPAGLLFTTGIEAGGFTRPGFVSSIQVINGAMSPAAIAALGGPTAGKLPSGNSVLQVTSVSWNGSAIKFEQSSMAGHRQSHHQPQPDRSDKRELDLLSSSPIRARHPGGPIAWR